MLLQGQKTTTTSMAWDMLKYIISKLKPDGENKYCLLISISIFTGLRIGDLLQLWFNQFENGENFTIVEMKTKKTKKIKINQDLKSMHKRIKKKRIITECKVLKT